MQMGIREGDGILCLGSLMVDILCPVQALPVSGEGAVVEGYSMALGGCAFNTANIIRQMGGDVFLLAPVGQGPFADFVRKELAGRGMQAIDIDASLDNGVALCFVEPDGERTMITLPGSERHFSRSWCEGIDFSRFSSVDICGYEIDGAGGDEIIAFLEEHPDLQVFFAPGPPTAKMARSKVARINALHPVWHLNEMEACAYVGCDDVVEAGYAIARECGNVVIVTLGSQGSYIFQDGSAVLVPADQVSVEDTIGAGDSHIGAVMAMRQRGASWQEAVVLANHVSGAVCSVQGSTLSDAEFVSYLKAAAMRSRATAV